MIVKCLFKSLDILGLFSDDISKEFGKKSFRTETGCIPPAYKICPLIYLPVLKRATNFTQLVPRYYMD